MTAVAHVSYMGGGIFLRDRGPGDRQTIIDYVARLTRSKARVQILLENQRWLVHVDDHAQCARCNVLTSAACREANCDAEAYCLRCAMTGPLARPALHRRSRRRHLTLALARA